MNIIKKITAAAIATLFIGTNAFTSVSAIQSRTPVAYRYFTVNNTNDARGSLYVDSDKVDATTELSGAAILGLRIKAYDSNGNNLHNQYYQITDNYYLGRTYRGGTIKRGDTYHYAKKGTNENSTTMTRTA